ncbi:MAG: hypothetical protein M1838_004020 [Thelocarpon superellum]|nr:MAG: hypothetical protein M1838_004020 [Thelocarpon superellum]
MALCSPWDSGDCSSPLSSLPSRSPSPPDAYPSPSSSQELGDSASVGLVGRPRSQTDDGDGPPPAKKRKTAAPKPRTTEYLDLRLFSSRPPQDVDERQPTHRPHLDALLQVLRTRRKIVVVVGAGISVSAGIPDFRSSTGLFRTLRTQHKIKASGKHLFDASVYKTDASTASFHDMVRSLSHLVTSTEPTPFHHLLATLAQQGRLLRLYSQNVDGIDTSLPPLATDVPLSAKGPWPRTIQLHGGLGKMVCQKCNSLSNFDASLFEGPEPPSCPDCVQLDSVRTTIAGKRSHGIGKLRPRIVLYNEYNPDEDAIGAVSQADLRCRPDAIIVVGTSLKVPGVRRIVKEMCGVVRGRRNGMAIWINNGPEPMSREFDKCWDLVVRGDADEVARLANMGRWDDEITGEYQEVGEAELTRVKAEQQDPQVIINSTKLATPTQLVQSILTPAASPYLKSTQAVHVNLGKKLPAAKKAGPSKALATKSKPKPKPKPNSLKTAKTTKKTVPSKMTQHITNTFKVTKTSNPASTVHDSVGKMTPLPKTADGLRDGSLSGLDNLQPLDGPSSSSSPLLPFRTLPPSTPTFHSSLGSDIGSDAPGNKSVAMGSESPESIRAKRNEIVSPKGPLPHGLEFLLEK